MDPDKVQHIMNLPRPETVSDIRGFVGHVSYYRRFISLFAVICQPLTNLLKKPPSDGTSLFWTKECTIAFEVLKSKLVFAPILVAPCWTKPFHVYVDAFNVAIGSVLSQKDDKGLDHPIYYTSRQLVGAECNYTTTEREALGMIYSVQKFRHYLLGYSFVFYVDHDALKYLINKPQLSGRIARWVLLLQEFNFTVVVRSVKQHANADHLSRLSNILGNEPVPDDLPDAALFVVDVISPEYSKIIQFLTFHTFPPTFTDKLKKRLILKSASYTMIRDALYKQDCEHSTSKEDTFRFKTIQLPRLHGIHDLSRKGRSKDFDLILSNLASASASIGNSGSGTTTPSSSTVHHQPSSIEGKRGRKLVTSLATKVMILVVAATLLALVASALSTPTPLLLVFLRRLHRPC
uniref:Reverse transcriptase RNase H-like domain-containing protein n=1 Tax=Physcomitrium patens TaxID=3218 RepID=A0A2K1ISS0_PHYPA|nr:hypothetical protein PHYPA_026434 [Physcomitrium patens]